MLNLIEAWFLLGLLISGVLIAAPRRPDRSTGKFRRPDRVSFPELPLMPCQ